MNDEQQLWRDVQKFMNQFPGFVSVAKKIGEVGDLEAWQTREQQKLDAITQEVENQRAAIASEREAADKEAVRKLQESEAKLTEHEAWVKNVTDTTNEWATAAKKQAQEDAEKLVSDAQARVKAANDEITRDIGPRKAALEKEIAALMDKMLAARKEHEETTNSLGKLKDEHSGFVKRLLGTAG